MLAHGTYLEQAFFLTQHASQFAVELNFDLRDKFRTSNYNVSAVVDNDLRRVCNRIQNMHEARGREKNYQFRVNDILTI